MDCLTVAMAMDTKKLDPSIFDYGQTPCHYQLIRPIPTTTNTKPQL